MTFAAENLKRGAQLFAGRLLRRNFQTLEEIPSGEGGVVVINGERLAVMKQPDGRCTALSAVCTHLGCIVGWNSTDRTWDCPCHGSRFDSNGEVLSGPAVQRLEPRKLPLEVA